MRCCVPFCKNALDNVSTSQGEKKISFHGFPSEVHLRAVWLRALGKQDGHLPDSAVVCSQHFLNDDIYESESGLRLLDTSAIPSTVQVCMICLDTDSKMFLMSKHKLVEAYEKLTGHPMCDLGNLKQTLCVQCAQRLINFRRFRDKSLRARALMMDLVERHELITRLHIKKINRTKYQLTNNMVLTTLGPDHCDLHILEHPSEDNETELEESGQKVVKTEESDDSMSVGEDMEVTNQDEYDNANNFVQDPLEFVSALSQCNLCFDELVDEHAYTQHMCIHLQNREVEYDTSQDCKPHTAASSSHSSLITEDKQADPSPSAHSAETLVAALSANNQKKVNAMEEVYSIQKTEPVLEISNGELQNQSTDCNNEKNTNINRLKKIEVKLYDIFRNKKTRKNVQSFDGQIFAYKDFIYQAISQNEIHTKESIESVADSSRVTLQSKTRCLNNDIYAQCNNSSRNCSNTENISFICDICQKNYKQKSTLTKHIKTHTEIEPFTCKICQYKCKYQRYFTEHMRTHTGEKPYFCTLCKYRCARSNDLLRHMRTHTGEKPYACKICEYKCTANTQLVHHTRTHTGEKPYSCKLCEFKSTTNSHLVTHMRTHTGEKPYFCTLCKYRCARSNDLPRHMRTHTGEKPYACKICEYKCTANTQLVNHMRTHTGEKPYSCKICEFKSTTNSHLISHMRTHTGVKPYFCTLCKYKCARNNDLQKHMRTHTGEKPYSCKICEFKSTTNSHLVTHMRTHTGEKPYFCTLCESKFARNGDLVNHLRTHTGEKPYYCTVCKYKCAKSSHLAKHMRTHTGEKPS